MMEKLIVIRDSESKYDGWWYDINRFFGRFPPGPPIGERVSYAATGEFETRSSDGRQAEVYRRVSGES